MPTKDQIVTIPFGAGLNEKADEKIVEPPVLLRAENVRVGKTGAVEKRNGFDVVSTTNLPAYTGTDFPNNVSYAAKGYPLLGSRQGYFAYDGARDAWYQTNDSYPPPAVFETFPVLRIALQDLADSPPFLARYPRVVDSAVSVEGYMCIAWTVSSGAAIDDNIWVMVYDLNTGATLLNPVEIDCDARSVRVIAYQDTFAILYTDDPSGVQNATGHYIDTTAATFTVSAPVVFAAGSGISAVSVPSNTYGLVQYTSGGTSNVHRIDSTLTVILTSVAIPSGTIELQRPSDDEIFLIDGVGTGAGTNGTRSLTADLLTLSATNVIPGVPNLSNTNGGARLALANDTGGLTFFVTGVPNLGTFSNKVSTAWHELTATGTATGSWSIQHDTSADSRGFSPDNMGPMIITRYDNSATPVSSNQKVQFCLERYTKNTAGVPTPSPTVALKPIGIFNIDIRRDRAVVVSVNSDKTAVNEYDGRFYLAQPVVTETNVAGINVTSMDFNPAPLRSTRVNNNIILSGSLVANYDNQIVFENTPLCRPAPGDNIARTASAPGPPASVSYLFAYKYVDNNGNTHRSGFSRVLDGPGGAGNNSITMDLLPRCPSALDLQYADGLFLEIYRADLDAATATPPDYGLIATIELPDPNDPAAETFQFEDSVPTAPTGELYNLGGVLESDAPPAFLDVTTANGRVWGISGDEPNTLWFSKKLVPSLAPEFSVALKLTVVGEQERLVAIGAMDDKVIVFARGAIYYIVGEGPNVTGGGATFVGPNLVSSDVGCINRNSVVEGPFGIMFLSQKGIYLIDRGLNITHIGAPVEDEMTEADGSQKILVSSVLVESQNQVRFCFGAEDSARPYMIVYDYFHEQWYVYTFFVGDPISCTAVSNAGEHLLVAENEISIENRAVYLDRASRIVPFIETAWIKLAGLAGYQRIKRAEFLINHTSGVIQIDAYVDYDDSSSDQFVWTEAEAGTVSPVDNYAVHIRRQKCEAIRFDIVEAAVPGPVTNDAGFSISGISLRAGVKQGVMKNNEAGKR